MAAGPTSQNAEDLELLRSNAVAAGIMSIGFFRKEIKSWTKGNASPVTEADVVVDKFLRNSLLAARPDYGWLSEESEDSEARLSTDRLFIVDPIDGTRAFMKGEDCWTICLSVVEKGRPVAGVVYAPARDEMYSACLGGGATLNSREMKRPDAMASPPVVPAPGAVHQELADAGFVHAKGPMWPSLAYRLVQAARGRIDIAVARRGAQDWDISAADIILSESGVVLEDVCAGRPRYNKRSTRHAALAVVPDPSLKGLVHNALKRVYGCPGEETHTKASER